MPIDRLFIVISLKHTHRRHNLSSGRSFDEESYAKAKPLIRRVMNDPEAAGKDVRDLLVALVQTFGDGVKPYILRFAQDLKEEMAK